MVVLFCLAVALIAFGVAAGYKIRRVSERSGVCVHDKKHCERMFISTFAKVSGLSLLSLSTSQWLIALMSHLWLAWEVFLLAGDVVFYALLVHKEKTAQQYQLQPFCCAD